MTELEATRILNEIRTVYPKFVRGRHLFTVRPDGSIEVWLAVGKSGQRWKSDGSIKADAVAAAIWIPSDVRARAAEFRSVPSNAGH